MKILAIVFVTAVCVSADIKNADSDFSNPYEAIKQLYLKDGRTLHDVKIVSRGSDTVMAKWSNGRGTLAFDLLPDKLVVALGGKIKQDNAGVKPSQNTNREPAGEDVFKSWGFDTRIVEASDSYVTISWKVTLKNNSKDPIRVLPTFLCKDAKGFLLEDGNGPLTVIHAGEQREITDTKILTRKVYDDIDKFGLKFRSLNY